MQQAVARRDWSLQTPVGGARRLSAPHPIRWGRPLRGRRGGGTPLASLSAPAMRGPAHHEGVVQMPRPSGLPMLRTFAAALVLLGCGDAALETSEGPREPGRGATGSDPAGDPAPADDSDAASGMTSPDGAVRPPPPFVP